MRASATARLRLWSLFILWTAFLYIYIGPKPLSGDSLNLVEISTTGNRINQLARAALLLAAIPLFLLQFRKCLELVRSIMPLLAVYAWLAASILWSDHPDMTLRRLIAEGFVLFMLISVVAAGAGIERIFRAWMAAVVAVVLLNLVSVVLYPSVAISELGVRGIYTQKNLAGTFALISSVAIGGAIFLVRDVRVRALVVAFWVVVLLFLYLTNSKTSLGVAALVISVAPVLYLVHVSGTAFSFCFVITSVTAAAVIIALLVLFDVSRDSVLAFVFGDPTLTGRTEIWSALLTNIRNRPMLGAGWAAFWDVGNTINPIDGPANAFFRDASVINSAHNGYIDIVVQAGFIGLILALILTLRFLYVFSRLVRADHLSLSERRTAAIFAALGVALVVNNFTESLILRSGNSFGLTFTFIYIVGEWLHWCRLSEPGAAAMARDLRTPRTLYGVPGASVVCPDEATSGATNIRGARAQERFRHAR